MLSYVAATIAHVATGIMLGMWKEKVALYSASWWAITSGFIPLLVYFLEVRPIFTSSQSFNGSHPSSRVLKT